MHTFTKRISTGIDQIKADYDVVVVGSGYGGGITASRLSRAGQTVCLLERGREILPGEFPNTEPEALEEMQFNTPDGHIGNRTGLYDIRVNDQQNVVLGCGLGGTSLINANVSLEPEPEVFSDPRWPQEFRNDQHTLLDRGTQLAREMLKPNPYPEHWPPLAKLAAHNKSARTMGEDFYRPPLNVTFEEFENNINHVGVEQPICTNCGDCVSGCNYGSKNTTAMNYLPDAHNHGAEIFCEVSVKYLEQVEDGWNVHYQPEGAGRNTFDAPTLFVKAKIVMLAAGTLGSTEILLRSRDKGLKLSEQLGQHFSGNGDILGFGYDCDDRIHGIGFGQIPPGEMDPVGPCITSVIDLRHGDEWQKRMVIEEGSIPGAIGNLIPVSMAAVEKLIGQDTESGIWDRLKDKIEELTSIIQGPYHGATNKLQTYLIMSHDNGDGKMTLENDNIRIHWPDVGLQPNFAIGNQNLYQATEALGGQYVKNPVWTELLRHSLITVHPLGGCVMADGADQGVVNHKGQVFSGTQGHDVYDGLYVSDGSVIPTSLAVNPLLTISSITERCCALMAEDYGWTIDYALPSKPKEAPESQTIGIQFTETMKGYFSSKHRVGDELEIYEEAAAAGKEDDSSIAFTLTIISNDLNATIENAQHRANIVGTIDIPALSDEPLLVNQGIFNLFVVYPETPGTKRMNYKMQLTDSAGKHYWFSGYKVVKDSPNVFEIWPATSTLYITIFEGQDDSGPVVGKGVMHIEPADFAKQMTTMKAFNASSLEEKIKAEARFGQHFAGVLYETYGSILYNPPRYNPDAPPRKKRPLRVGTPELFPFTTDDGVDLRLTRYQGGHKGPVMLVHGLGVSSRIFSTDTIDTNLLEYLYAHEYDVWLLDFRVSIELPAAKVKSNGDQIAQFDYPAAVNTIKHVTGCETVQAVVHCYGATTFFMSMLAGLKDIRSIVCSQIATNIVIPTATKIKAGLYIPGFLEKLGVESMTAYVDNNETWLDKIYDKALDVYGMVEAQGQCNNPVCHRITFMYASLYRHETLNNLLHSNLHELFAEANIASLEHLARLCREGVLVNAQGEDVYMPHIERLNLPIRFISGAMNECYLPESTERTYQMLCENFGSGNFSRNTIPGYGHIDCIFGANAVDDVYPIILEHLEKTSEA